MRRFIVLFLFSLSIAAFGQAPLTIKGTVPGIVAKKVYLIPDFGFNNRPVDSALVAGNSFYFTLSPKIKKGFYKLDIGKDLKGEFYNEPSKKIQLIINGENIDFLTTILNPFDSIKVFSSVENRLYYDFLNRNHKLNVQMGILDQLPEFFPVGDDFYPDIIKEYSRVQKKSIQLYEKVFKDQSNSIAAHICRSEQLPVMDLEWSQDHKFKYVKSNFFSNVDFRDTILLITDVFSTKIVDYIKFLTNKQLDEKGQSSEYMKAIDTILSKARVNEKVYRFVLDYLIAGFEQIEMDNILVYIHDNYLKDNSCNNDNTSLSLKTRVEGYKKLSIGSPAPPLIFTDDAGKETDLYKVPSDFTMILFYASWCPHCAEMLPEIRDIYNSLKKKNPGSFEVIAISLDTTKTDWLNFLSKGNYSWINYSDLKRWDSKIINDYFVYATPTMILVDREKKIVSKPITLQQLKSFLLIKGLDWNN